MKKCQITIIIVSVFLLMSCTSPEYKAALTQYQLAKSTQNIEQLVQALTTLANLAPEKYQAELLKVEHAQYSLKQALSHQAQHDDYAAYMASHASYRNVPNTAAKRVLIKAGKTLFPLLQAQLNLEHSFSFRPQQLTPMFEKYSRLPINDWDLITVNNTIEQLSKSIHALNKALKSVKLNNSTVKTTQWQSAIAQQLALVTDARNYFANLARYQGAKKLQTLNNNLRTESIKLLSLVRPKLAKESIQPAFIKAKNSYAPLQGLIENLSLAANLSKKDIHIAWYQHWHNIETTILMPEGDFSL
ncbi:MAG: hypothetical protein ACPG52_12625, partial [Cognaticolwellia sp.]